VQEPNHDFFSPHTGQAAHPHIQVRPPDGGLVIPQDGVVLPDTPILRTTTFGDVHIAHHLDGRDHRASQDRLQCRDVVQHAINAVAYPQSLWGRLKVNVTGAVAQSITDQGIDALALAFRLG